MAVDLDRIVASLDLETKVALISGTGAWTLRGVPEIGLRPMKVSDGPVGVRGGTDTEIEASASFPCGSAMGATWDPELMRRTGSALAAEARRKGVDVVLGPTVNLHRSPFGGRHFECLSEDPLLSGGLAAELVRGVQDAGVGACLKHYVANEAETERQTVDNVIDPTTLHELYLAPFEMVVEDASPWSVMAAYNGVNGAPMTESPLLDEPLKGAWRFDGAVISDWGAVYDARSVAHGCDLAMPGPEPRWGANVVAAVRSGDLDESVVDDKVTRLLRLAMRVGAFDPPVPSHSGATGTGWVADAAALAREIAASGMVLVENDGTLPLDLGGAARVAVIGPGARNPRVQGGGSSTVAAPYIVTPATGIAAALPPEVELEVCAGGAPPGGLRPPRADELVGEDGIADVTVSWLDAEGAVIARQRGASAVLIRPVAETPAGAVAVRMSARFAPDEPGRWMLGATGFGDGRLIVDGRLVADEGAHQSPFDAIEMFQHPHERIATVEVREGGSVAVEAEFAWSAGVPFFRVGIGVGRVLDADAERERAVTAARAADVAIVLVGTDEDVESEGVDRSTLTLPGDQDALVEAVLDVNPRTVVVVTAGAPVEMPWRDRAAAVLLAWFPGMEFGNALADVLLGTREPGGRLPTTWPVSEHHVPVRETSPTAGRLEYVEGRDIGFRAYLGRGLAPAYWFGFGLGYTRWRIEAARPPASAIAGRPFDVAVDVANTGARRGATVVQVYAVRPGDHLPVLAGHAKVEADAGSRAHVTVTVDPRPLRAWTAAGWSFATGRVALRAAFDAGSAGVEMVVDIRE